VEEEEDEDADGPDHEEQATQQPAIVESFK
jgi:hypothetical protein